MESSGFDDAPLIDKASKKTPQLVRVHPRYIRLRQGGAFAYHIKLMRPPSRGKGVTVNVRVVNNKSGISVQPMQVLFTASDWRMPREVNISCDLDADIRTIQIYHKIHESSDEVYSSSTIVPSVFVSVLQKEATFLFAFGCGLFGRLGTNSELNANLPTPFACKWLHPVQIACGKAHSAIIDVYSNIYCFGDNSSGQLGQGDSNLEPSKLPLRVPSVGMSTILQVACGSNHTICMTVEGKIFTWGDNTFGQLGIGTKFTKPRATPTRVEKVINVRSLHCGGNQSFLVSLDNNVLAAGSNIAGQLGFGDRLDRVTFERIPFFRKHFATMATSNSRELLNQAAATAALPVGEVELACGLYHTMACCGRRVYSWGNGDDGRLGHGDIEGYPEPTLVESLKDVPIRHIACGGSHSGAISVTYDVYTWGNGQYGQIGHGAMRNRRVPTRVRLLSNKKVTQLSFGEWHSMALCDDGTLYSWGFGEEGQLGLPEDKKLAITRIVPFPTIVSAMSGTGATIVRCGGAHTFVVSVLESRRPQLAKLHRKASQMEIHSEMIRLAKLERQRSRHSQQSYIDTLLEVDDDDDDDNTPQVSKAMSTSTIKPIVDGSETKSRKQRIAPKHNRDCEFLDRDDDTTPKIDFSWQDRPLSSRKSVRNAFRQEMRVVVELKTMLKPHSAPPSSTCRKKEDATFVSPRLRRLHEQVVRTTEIGSAITRTHALVKTDTTADQIRDAVEQATKSLLRPKGVGTNGRLTPRISTDNVMAICESPDVEIPLAVLTDSEDLGDDTSDDDSDNAQGVVSKEIDRRWPSRTQYVMED